jgi:hypothetical protein
MSRREKVDLDALLCALILVPNSFSRNKFFHLFEEPGARRVRRRAARVRGIIRQLVGDGKSKAEIVGEQVLNDGQVLLRYRVHDLDLYRTTALSELEAAALRYALWRAGESKLELADRDHVEAAFARLSKSLRLDDGARLLPPE